MDIHPVFKAMNSLHYDAATVGNHEFNYGLDFLHKSLQGANFPYVNANIYIDDRNNYDGHVFMISIHIQLLRENLRIQQVKNM